MNLSSADSLALWSRTIDGAGSRRSRGAAARVMRLWRSLSAHQLLLLGYAVITLCGAGLLSLPAATASGEGQPFLDAVFVATSGISTSGLTVVDIGDYYSLFGQVVLLVIFQIGGLGYMGFVIVTMYLLGIRGSIRTGLVAKESMAGTDMHVLRGFFGSVLLYSFVFEAIGAVILSAYWAERYSIGRACYLGVFHSVSAFCTAGFGLFSDSLCSAKGSLVVNLTVIVVSLAGGLGFFVLRDLAALVAAKARGKRARLTVHSKLALSVTAAVVAVGTVVILLAERWPAGTGAYERVVASAFQSVSASTTDGFNTIDIGAMGAASLTFIMFLMFVGASPGSTGGGIKTTTFGLLLVLLWSRIRRRANNAFGREVSERCVYDAVIVALVFGLIAFVDLVVLSITEDTSYLQNAFEIVSALGNTGLSMGITASLSATAKVVLIATMFVGRVGILILAFALFPKPPKAAFRFAKEDVLVG